METVVCARLGRVLVAATSFVLFFLFELFFLVFSSFGTCLHYKWGNKGNNKKKKK